MNERPILEKTLNISDLLPPAEQRDVCIFSQRAIRRDVSRCSGYEFEDVVMDLEQAKILVPDRAGSREILYRARRWLSKRTPYHRLIPSGTRGTPVSGPVDLFGCFVQKPVELLSLDAAGDWRKNAKMAFCVIEELWHTTIDEFEPLVKSLSQFDLITCAFESSCERLSKLTGRPVIHLPGAADLLAFQPKDPNLPRPIDVYYMGRRRPDLHELLKPALEERGNFYLYDSAAGAPIAQDHVTHRQLLSSLVGRSKLFVVDYGKIGHADQRTGQLIWGPRHVEGMAGGAVQVGYAPDTPDFHAAFDWPEAVERLPEDPASATRAILSLIDAPSELKRRRDVNFAQAAVRHDWLHRWALITDHFGLTPTAQALTRQSELTKLQSRFT